MDLLQSIREHEGFRSKPYPDPLHGWDVPTFGIGFTWITEEESEYLLNRRVSMIRERLTASIPIFDSLPGRVQDILIEMGFQLGVVGLLKFKRTLAAINKGDYEEAADEMLDSKWARQVPRRAKRLATRMRNESTRL